MKSGPLYVNPLMEPELNRQLLLAIRGDEKQIDLVQSLLKNKANPNARNGGVWGETALIFCIMRYNLAAFTLLIEAKANLDEKDRREGLTALMWAIGSLRTEFVISLIAARANFEEKNDMGSTAIISVSAQKFCGLFQEAVLPALLAAKADVHARDKEDRTPLMLICQEPMSQKKAKLLIEAKVDLEAKDKDGNTALMHAVQHCFQDDVFYLLRAKANVFARNNKGETALDIAKKDQVLGKLHIDILEKTILLRRRAAFASIFSPTSRLVPELKRTHPFDRNQVMASPLYHDEALLRPVLEYIEPTKPKPK